MKVLFIGGTGTISMAITKRLLNQGEQVILLNRGSRNAELEAMKEQKNIHLVQIMVDVNDEEAVREKLQGLSFDVVADFIAYGPKQLERDFRLFDGRTKQFIYISSASVYQKPPADFRMNEGTTAANPYWQYSRDKIAGEEYLLKMYRENGFPITIVRPSHTFDDRSVPVAVHGKNGSWQVLKRMKEGKKVIIQGDGTSLWTITHSSDFAVGFTGLLLNPHAVGQTIQIMSEESMTWNQIYQVIADALHVELQCVHISSDFLVEASKGIYDFEGSLLGDKSQSVSFDISRLKRLVPEFCPETSARRLRNTVENVCAHPEYQKEDPEFDAFCDRVIAAREQALEEVRKGKNL